MLSEVVEALLGVGEALEDFKVGERDLCRALGSDPVSSDVLFLEPGNKFRVLQNRFIGRDKASEVVGVLGCEFRIGRDATNGPQERRQGDALVLECFV